jgi:protein-disulfide isomerase
MSSDPTARLTLPVGDRDHIQGRADAPAILVEYGDYECPICGAAYVTVKEIQQAMGDRLGFVFRNFPLTETHPHAKDAAQAAEAAGAQGSFWEMHDMLFENQDDLDRDHIAGYAEALGLDATRLIEDVATDVHAKHVQEDFRSGVRSGVNGTPTFFMNGVRYDGSHDTESMVAALTAQSEQD